MSPISLLLFVAGGICLVLAILSFRKPRVIQTSIAGKSLWLPIRTYKELVNSLESARWKRERPEHLEVSRKSEASGEEPTRKYDQWILDNILEIIAADGIEDPDALLSDIGQHIPMAIVQYGVALKAWEARVRDAAKVKLSEKGCSAAEIETFLEIFNSPKPGAAHSKSASDFFDSKERHPKAAQPGGSPVVVSLNPPTAPIPHDGELTERPPRPPVI